MLLYLLKMDNFDITVLVPTLNEEITISEFIDSFSSIKFMPSLDKNCFTDLLKSLLKIYFIEYLVKK